MAVSLVVVRVAVAVPLRTAFDYLPPADTEIPAVGMRVRVPFGNRTRVGVVLAVTDHSEIPEQRLRPIISVLDDVALLPTDCLELLQWASEYFHHPIGEVVVGTLPKRLRNGASATLIRSKRYLLTEAGAAAVAQQQLQRAPRQRELLQRIASSPHGLADADLVGQRSSARTVLRKLLDKGWVRRVDDDVEPSLNPPTTLPPVCLNDDQQAAVDMLRSAVGSFGAYLLEGVTGGGKTEVYLALIQHVVERGFQALVLIPEIGLTLQIMSRFTQRLDCAMSVLHSGLSDRERTVAWLRARSGEAKVIVGTRSAVFVPAANLGLIVVDEEHDLSFKQQEGFRYSARDLAVVRAQRSRIPVVLGSATPSLETLLNVYRKRYGWVRLPKRAGAATPPTMEIIDIRRRRLTGGISQPLAQALCACVSSGKQALLFVNRRGYAPVFTCHDCGWVSECLHCDARLTWHREDQQLRCHYCGAISPAVDNCPACAGSHLYSLGIGTQRCVAAVQKLLPDARVERIDRDSTSHRGSLEQVLQRIHAGNTDVLVGTQMVAKGHHFSRVTLVGIVDADSGLYGVDLRSPERMGQLLIQVAGRAGREGTAGRVLIQTRHPDHPLLRTLVRDGYGAFSEQALVERKASNMAPFSNLSMVRAEARTLEDALRFLQRAGTCAADCATKIAVLGPVPAPMPRRADRYRAQLLLQASDRTSMQQFLQAWIPQLEVLPEVNRVRWSIDVDPQDTT